MKPNIGLKKHSNGKLVLINLATGDVLSGLMSVDLHDNNSTSDAVMIVATLDMRGITSVGEDYAPPEKKDHSVKLAVDIDTRPFLESLRSLGEDLIKMAGKS